MASRKQKTEGEKLAAARIRKERADRGLTKSGEQSKRPGRTVPKATKEAAAKAARKRNREASVEAALQEVGGREQPLSTQATADKPVSTGTSFEMDPEYRRGSEAQPTGAALANLAEGYETLGMGFDANVSNKAGIIDPETGKLETFYSPVELMRQRELSPREKRGRAAGAAAAAARREFKARENPLPITADEAIRAQRTFTDTTVDVAGKEVNVPGKVVTADPAGKREAYKDRKTGELRVRTVPKPNIVQPERPRAVDTRTRKEATEAKKAAEQVKALTALEVAREGKTVETGRMVERMGDSGSGVGGQVVAGASPERRLMTRSEALRSGGLEPEQLREITKSVKATDILEFSDIGSKRQSRVPADIVGSVGTPEEQEAFFKRVSALEEATDPERIKAGETGQISDTGAITYTDSQGNVVRTDQLRQYGGAPLTENMSPDDARNLVRRIKGNKRGSEIDPFPTTSRGAQGREQIVVSDPDTDEFLGKDDTARLRDYIGKGANPTQRAAREQQVLESSGTSVRKDQETEIYRASAGGKSLRQEVTENWAPYRDALKGISVALSKTTDQGQAELARRGGGALSPSANRKKVQPQTEMTVDEAIRQYSIQEGTRKLAEAEMTDFTGKGPSQSALRYRKGPVGTNVLRENSGGVRLAPGGGSAAPTDLDLAKMQVTQPRLAYNLDKTRGGAVKSGQVPKGRKGGKSNKQPQMSYAPGVVNDETIDRAKSTTPLVGSGGKEIATQTTLGGGKLSVQFQTPRGPQEGSAFLVSAPSSVDASKVAPGASYPGEGGKRVSSTPSAWFEPQTRLATPEAVKRAAMREYRGTGMAIARQQQSDRTMESPSAAKSRRAGEDSRRANTIAEESRRAGSLNKALSDPTSAVYQERSQMLEANKAFEELKSIVSGKGPTQVMAPAPKGWDKMTKAQKKKTGYVPGRTMVDLTPEQRAVADQTGNFMAVRRGTGQLVEPVDAYKEVYKGKFSADDDSDGKRYSERFGSETYSDYSARKMAESKAAQGPTPARPKSQRYRDMLANNSSATVGGGPTPAPRNLGTQFGG